MSLDIRRARRASFVLAVASACTVVLADRAVASIPMSRTDIVSVGDLRAADSVSGVSRIAAISQELLSTTMSTEQEFVPLSGFANSLVWEGATASELSDALDFIPDSPDKLLASVGETTETKIVRAASTRRVVTGDPSLGSLSGDDVSTGLRPVGGDLFPGLDVDSVTRFTGATQNRLETVPVPGAMLLAAFGIGLVGIARFRGWVC